jgi:hypothetical protein
MVCNASVGAVVWRTCVAHDVRQVVMVCNASVGAVAVSARGAGQLIVEATIPAGVC